MARRSTPTIQDAGLQYADHAYTKGGSADVRRKAVSLTRRLSEHVGHRQVGTLTPDHVETFFYGRGGLATSCASTTLANYRNTLKAFLTWCWRRKWCDDPEYLLGGVVNRSTRSRRVRLRLSEGQLWGMVEACDDPRDRAMLIFAMHTGCRISEILKVRLCDLNLPASEVLLHIIKTKEEDVMTLSGVFESEMREWLTVYTATSNPSPDARLFPARGDSRFIDGERHPTRLERGYKPHSRISSPGRLIRGIAASADIEFEDGDGWHTVRRSVARLFFDHASVNGHDAALRMTAAFLHHAHTSTTEAYLGLQHERRKRDEVMSAGFLQGVGDVARLDDYRKAD